MDPLERGLLIRRQADQRDQRYLEVMLVLNTIMAAASQMAGGKGNDKLQDMIKDYNSLVYPESDTKVEDLVEKTRTIMKMEHERGPMQVQAREYGKKRRKKPR